MEGRRRKRKVREGKEKGKRRGKGRGKEKGDIPHFLVQSDANVSQ